MSLTKKSWKERKWVFYAIGILSIFPIFCLIASLLGFLTGCTILLGVGPSIDICGTSGYILSAIYLFIALFFFSLIIYKCVFRHID